MLCQWLFQIVTTVQAETATGTHHRDQTQEERKLVSCKKKKKNSLRNWCLQASLSLLPAPPPPPRVLCEPNSSLPPSEEADLIPTLREDVLLFFTGN